MRPTEEMYEEVQKIIREIEDKMPVIRNFNPMWYDTLLAYYDYADFSRKKQMDEMTVLILTMKKHGASDLELARAIMHAFVIFETRRVLLDYKQSEKDQGIPELMEKYFYEAALLKLKEANANG